MRKIVLITFLFVFAFNSVGLAAVSSSKPKSSSMPKSSTTQKAPATQADGYKPSTPANTLSEKAPAAKAPAAQAQQQSTSSSFMRNLGMFGGGMLLGSMLGSMFGFGHSEFLSSLIGMVFNVLLLAGIFMGGRYLWNRFKTRKKDRHF